MREKTIYEKIVKKFSDEVEQEVIFKVNESPIQTMKDCSVVTATYELGEGVRGTIGIVGPKRMDYEKVMANLNTLKKSLDGILDKPKGEV